LLSGFSLFGSTGAFSFDTTKRYAFQKDPVSTESYLAQLESEYAALQDSLLLELSTTNIHGHDHAEEIVEDMLEKAADVAAFQRYRMEEVVEEATDEMTHARTDRRVAHFVKEQAHREADMVAEFDGAYEDLERTRTGL
jgi:uroporphyrinogen-III synthase